MAAEYSQGGFGSQIRKARYQITKNVFVSCYLEILDANNDEVRVLLGVKHRSDAQVPIGTRIFFNVDGMATTQGEFHTFSVTVLKTEVQGDKWLHICTPISKTSQSNRRKQERKQVSFPVLLVDSQTLFSAVDGCVEGLALSYSAQKAILKLTVNNTYDFKVNCKGEDCQLQGVVKYIQYDWRTFHHRVGLHFPNLSKDEQIILNLLVDPAYKVPISENQTVDTSTGKISLND